MTLAGAAFGPFGTITSKEVKIGERVYPGLAARVTDEKQFEALLASAAKKYPRFKEGGDRPPDFWIFRIEPIP